MDSYCDNRCVRHKFKSIKNRIDDYLKVCTVYSEVIALNQIRNEIDEYEKSMIVDKFEWIRHDYEQLKNKL